MKTLADIMREVEDLEYRMIRKTLVYKCPITQDLEFRVAYFTNNYEATLWEKSMEQRYTELQLEHHVYTDIIKK